MDRPTIGRICIIKSEKYRAGYNRIKQQQALLPPVLTTSSFILLPTVPSSHRSHFGYHIYMMTASRDDVVGSEERRYKSALTKSQRKMMKGALENLKKVKMNIEEYESKLRAGTFDPIAIRDSIMDDFEVITNAEEVGRGSGALTASIITSRHRAECERVLAELFILTNGNETILEAVPDAEKGYAEDLLSFQRKARRYQNELQAVLYLCWFLDEICPCRNRLHSPPPSQMDFLRRQRHRRQSSWERRTYCNANGTERVDLLEKEMSENGAKF